MQQHRAHHTSAHPASSGDMSAKELEAHVRQQRDLIDKLFLRVGELEVKLEQRSEEQWQQLSAKFHQMSAESAQLKEEVTARRSELAMVATLQEELDRFRQVEQPSFGESMAVLERGIVVDAAQQGQRTAEDSEVPLAATFAIDAAKQEQCEAEGSEAPLAATPVALDAAALPPHNALRLCAQRLLSRPV